jgi:hypothetical protein
MSTNYLCDRKLSENPDDKIVEHLLANRLEIDWYLFNTNTNKIAIAFCNAKKMILINRA